MQHRLVAGWELDSGHHSGTSTPAHCGHAYGKSDKFLVERKENRHGFEWWADCEELGWLRIESC